MALAGSGPLRRTKVALPPWLKVVGETAVAPPLPVLSTCRVTVIWLPTLTCAEGVSTKSATKFEAVTTTTPLLVRALEVTVKPSLASIPAADPLKEMPGETTAAGAL